ncbi:MAG: bifunctional 5,10-methylenetetrahydrofolate dehydrogenase/5,10-methenyltetrahydrofolate cyclohydrolase [Bdellovibrionales bacterium]|nr:bifunctional 5,10-methylenetetrahydrofolate dehydrogenase/5,10-methenyltetrahydrofolate cyclohydrolase [Bdellovibrionales bacterium]
MLSLLGKPVVEALSSALEEQLSLFKKRAGRPPRLEVIIVGNDPASHLYVRNKRRMAQHLGMSQALHEFPSGATADEVRSLVERLNQNDQVDGILIQRPLPSSFDLSDVARWIHPLKDVDAFHPLLAGNLLLGIPTLAPCTPTGILALLSHYGLTVAGKVACVVGRSPIVGKPLSAMLLNADATVINCHRKTRNLSELTSRADFLFVAAGSPQLIGRDHVKSGAVVIDVGIHKLPDGTWCGDVRSDEVAQKAAALSPVPGGVGPLTIFMLMRNVVLAAQSRLNAQQDEGVRRR